MTQTVDCESGDRSGDKPRQKGRPTGRPPRAPLHCERRWSRRQGVWLFRAVVRVGDARLRGSWGTLADADRDARAFMAQRETLGEAALIKLEEACQDVLDTVRGRPGTWRCYEEHFQTLTAHLGAATPLQSITPAVVEAFVRDRRAARWRGAPISDTRIVKNLGALRRVFRLAIRRGKFAGASPLDRVELPRVRSKPAGHYSLDEIKRVVEVLRASPDRTSGMAVRVVLLLFFTGLRRDELCRTTIGQVDVKGGWIRDVDGKCGFRSVPIRPPAATLIEQLAAGQPADGFLVPSGRARPAKPGRRERTALERRESYVAQLFRRHREKLPAELRARFHAHTLRHSCKTWLMDCGVPAAVRDAITGHSSGGVAGRYEHSTPAKVQHYAGAAFDQLMHLVQDGVAQSAQG